jgi:hypothetical protein
MRLNLYDIQTIAANGWHLGSPMLVARYLQSKLQDGEDNSLVVFAFLNKEQSRLAHKTVYNLELNKANIAVRAR